MYIVLKCRDYGKRRYNAKSVIGIYDNFLVARQHVIDKMTQLKYEFDIEIDTIDHFFAKTSRL